MGLKKMTKLQCGWEDECTEDNCHHCPRKHKITIEVTDAELCVVEDCAMVDLIQHSKEKPKVYDLTQDVMRDLMRKLFKEIE